MPKHHPFWWTASLLLLLGGVLASAAQAAGRGPIQLTDNRRLAFDKDPVIGKLLPIVPVCPPVACTGVTVFGRVIASPHVVALYWDNAWDTDPTNAGAPKRATINAMIQGTVGSPYLDAARQYGVGRGYFHSAHESFKLCGSQRPHGPTSYLSLALWVECMVQLPGTGVPYPDENTMYAVFLPDGVTITGSPLADCKATAAFHAFSAAVVSDPTIFNPFAFRVQGFPFTVVPQQCMGDADLALQLDNYSQAWSHELVEAATDPAPPTGWVDNAHAPDLVPWLNTGEAGDICQPSAKAPDGTPTTPVRSFATNFLLLETYWSNIDHACVPKAPVPPPTPGVDPVGVIERAGADMGTTAFVEGYVIDGDALMTPAHVKVFVDGTASSGAPFYDQLADLIRADVVQAYPGATPDHGFDVSIPGLSQGNHQLYVYGVNVGPTGTLALIGQVAVSIPLPVQHAPTASLSLVGAIEPAGIHLAGTAVSTLDPSASLTIIAYIDGVPGVGTPYTLGATTPGGGFDATIGGLSPVDHTVHVYASDPAAGAEVLVGVGQATPPFWTAPLQLLAPPFVVGAALVGSELTCAPAGWLALLPDDGAIPSAWSWLRDSIVIQGAIAETYTPAAADGGHRIACAESVISSLNPFLSNTVISDSVLVGVPPPVNVSVPSLRGEGVIGTLVACSTGRWQNAPYRFERQWLRGKSGALIEGATENAYAPTEADRNSSIRCRVTASNDGGPTEAFSLGVTVTAPPPPIAPVVVTAPTISGLAVVGSVLSCSTGTWQNAPTTFAYVWSRAGVALGSAMSAAYTVVAADVGKAVACTVTASNDGGGASSTSAPVLGRALVQCVVPAVARVTLAVARQRLLASHCAVGAVTKARSRTIARGRVIRAGAAIGSRHAVGFRVSLLVSLGR